MVEWYLDSRELSDNDLKIRLKDILPHHNNLDQLLPLVKPRMRLLSDYEKITEFLFTEVLILQRKVFLIKYRKRINYQNFAVHCLELG